MATLIPSIGTPAFDSTGARRLAVRLEQKLYADYIPLLDRAFPKVAPQVKAYKEGYGRGDMAVPCADRKTMDLRDIALTQRKLSHHLRNRRGEYQPDADAIQVMTIKVNKGLVFPFVALPGVAHTPALGEDEKEPAQVFYVTATRAMQRLALGVGWSPVLSKQL